VNEDLTHSDWYHVAIQLVWCTLNPTTNSGSIHFICVGGASVLFVENVSFLMAWNGKNAHLCFNPCLFFSRESESLHWVAGRLYPLLNILDSSFGLFSLVQCHELGLRKWTEDIMVCAYIVFKQELRTEHSAIISYVLGLGFQPDLLETLLNGTLEVQLPNELTS
jgi:hypothetical protein